MKINIAGLDKAQVLAALYNASKLLGMGILEYDATPMTTEGAQAEINSMTAFNPDRLYFDYLKGRVMKVDLMKDELDPWLYDRDNGEGAAQRALAPLLETTSA